ncbi:MAG: hypothetical protein ACXACP_09490 [Candidatus Hodarchaeales archaeon]|jgi:hypothetical protein
MRKNQRKRIFSTYLTTILKDGGSNNFVIFTDALTKRFVQFVGCKDDKLVIVDIPKQQLLPKEVDRLKTIFVLFEEMEFAFQGEVSPEQGVLIADKIFLDVYESSDDYTVNVDIILE